jgi:hypothetical protein
MSNESCRCGLPHLRLQVQSPVPPKRKTNDVSEYSKYTQNEILFLTYSQT